MDYLQYVDADSLLHRLDPRTKFLFFLVMAILTSVIKSGVALLFLFAFFIAMWCTCRIQKYILVLAGKLKVLLAFIFLLWLILGLFETPAVQGGPIFFETVMPFFNGQGISICFDWYDLYKGAVYALRIFLMISSFYTVLLTTNLSLIHIYLPLNEKGRRQAGYAKEALKDEPIDVAYNCLLYTSSITLLRVSSYWETVVTGGVVLVAVTIDAIEENPIMRDKFARIFKRK